MTQTEPTTPTGPVFVVGMQRSGTSLMRSMLNAHPSIAMAPLEWRYFDLVGRARGGVPIADLDSLWNTIVDSMFFETLELDATEVRARLDRKAPVDPRTLFDEVMSSYADLRGKPRWGEKTPGNEQQHATLREWFPDLRFVHMIRDPRSVVGSLLTVDWERRMRPYVDGFAARWRDSVRLAREGQARGTTYIAQYERLVGDPEAEMRAVCAFLGESFEPTMLEPRPPRTRRPNPPPPGRPSNDGAITHTRVDLWKEILDHRQIAVIEQVARREMECFGYDTVTDRLPTRHWPAYSAWRAARVSVRAARRLSRRQ